MKKKNILFALAFILPLLASCGGSGNIKPNNNPTPSEKDSNDEKKPEEKTIKEISVVGAENEKVVLNTKYVPSEDVEIYLIYSDGSEEKVDISKVNFDVDTTSIGAKDCTATYGEYSVTFTVEVTKKTGDAEFPWI